MALQKGDKSTLVKKWQQFLIDQQFISGNADGNFGKKTEDATKAFQQFYKLQADGKAGSVTLGKAYELGFNPDKEITSNKVRNDKDMMQWIKINLGEIIKEAVKNSIYTADWLAGMGARETGFLFAKYYNQGFSYNDICLKMKGDYCKRQGEKEKQYHGFGFWQIDTGSYPVFINAGDWQDPLKTAIKAVNVLEEKRKYLIQKGWDKKLSAILFERAITAAYNCGQGNVNKA
ncbi:MAG: peptidoglycan-binding protein, partial [Fimbriimonadaceae bacterium]|nr:peptidoglycan-binding protein [Chitinophagales bacterium]